MNEDFDLDMCLNAEVRGEVSMEERLNSIQQLIHELSYSIRTQREQITRITSMARENAARSR